MVSKARDSLAASFVVSSTGRSAVVPTSSETAPVATRRSVRPTASRCMAPSAVAAEERIRREEDQPHHDHDADVLDHAEQLRVRFLEFARPVSPTVVQRKHAIDEADLLAAVVAVWRSCDRAHEGADALVDTG